MPARIAALLHTVRIMLGFGRELAATAKERSTSHDFNAIAACFGTGRLFAIMAHLQRGILRATALQNVLLERAARGRDIGFGAPRKLSTATPAVTPAVTPAAPAELPANAPTDLPATQLADAPATQSGDAPAAAQAAEAPAARKQPPPSRPFGWNDPELFMPTLVEFEAEVRRRPLGVTLVEICLDLAVLPGFCTGPFWNEVFDAIRLRGGSVAVLMLEKARREEAFAKEQDRKIGSNWDWQQLTLDAVRRVLGRLIGEGADAAFDPVTEPSGLAAGPS